MSKINYNTANYDDSQLPCGYNDQITDEWLFFAIVF
jgi:hypothetical protein